MPKPRLLKGFRDFKGDELVIRKNIFSVFEEVFKKYGYEPLETPTLEYAEVLLDKYGEEEKLVYQFEDFGGRKVAMRYDLTVPTSRVMALYRNELTLPWKRYQIQPVWRADNTQKGRFREFYQLDADTFGSKSVAVDAEFIDMGIEIIQKLGFKDFRVRLNNRKILNAIAKYSGYPDKFADIVYAIDKWDKRTEEQTREDLMNRINDAEAVDKVLECINLKGDSLEMLAQLKEKFVEIQEGVDGVEELETILNLVATEGYLEYDPTIARGLAYYTGPIWEWEILEGGVGSIGGCGRYDELVGTMLGEDIPATGGSFGIERIIEVMKDRGLTDKFLSKDDMVLVTVFSEELLSISYETANSLRSEGFKTVLFPKSTKLSKQLDFANKKNIRWVVIIGEDEAKQQKLLLKDMNQKTQELLSFDLLVEKLRT